MKRVKAFSNLDVFGDFKSAVKAMFNLEAQAKGFETREEANDFDVEDDFDFEPFSPYEIKDMIDEVEDDNMIKPRSESSISDADEEPEIDQEKRLKEIKDMGVTLHELKKLVADLESSEEKKE